MFLLVYTPPYLLYLRYKVSRPKLCSSFRLKVILHANKPTAVAVSVAELVPLLPDSDPDPT